MHIVIKSYEYTTADTIYPIDKDGNRMCKKYGIGKIRKTLAGGLKILFEGKIKDEYKYLLTSRFETSNGHKFTSIKLKNYLLKS